MRSKQPYNTSTVLKADAPCHHSEPTVCESFEVGDICVLIDEDKWKIGKVLKFAYYKEKKKRSRMYQATSVRLNEGKNLGVVCSWFTKSPTQQNEFSAEQADCQHKFTPISSYSCTLYIGCFEEIESTSHANHTTQNSITRTDRQVIMLQTAKRFTISDNTISVIKSLYASKSSASSVSSSQTLSSLDAEDSLEPHLTVYCWARSTSNTNYTNSGNSRSQQQQCQCFSFRFVLLSLLFQVTEFWKTDLMAHLEIGQRSWVYI